MPPSLFFFHLFLSLQAWLSETSGNSSTLCVTFTPMLLSTVTELEQISDLWFPATKATVTLHCGITFCHHELSPSLIIQLSLLNLYRNQMY